MSKTCGECRYYEHPAGQCSKVIEYNNCHITDKACEYFEPEVTTNGDKIRQMSNEELNKFLTLFSLQGCKYCTYSQVDGDFVLCQKTKNNHCVDGLMEWLNAPADCVKQNGNHDTQADLCKVDNTEIEGKDEEKTV